MKLLGININYPEACRQVIKYLLFVFLIGFIPSLFTLFIDPTSIALLTNYLNTLSGQYSKWWISAIIEPLAGFFGIWVGFRIEFKAIRKTIKISEKNEDKIGKWLELIPESLKSDTIKDILRQYIKFKIETNREGDYVPAVVPRTFLQNNYLTNTASNNRELAPEKRERELVPKIHAEKVELRQELNQNVNDEKGRALVRNSLKF